MTSKITCYWLCALESLSDSELYVYRPGPRDCFLPPEGESDPQMSV